LGPPAPVRQAEFRCCTVFNTSVRSPCSPKQPLCRSKLAISRLTLISASCTTTTNLPCTIMTNSDVQKMRRYGEVRNSIPTQLYADMLPKLRVGSWVGFTSLCCHIDKLLLVTSSTVRAWVYRGVCSAGLVKISQMAYSFHTSCAPHHLPSDHGQALH